MWDRLAVGLVIAIATGKEPAKGQSDETPTEQVLADLQQSQTSVSCAAERSVLIAGERTNVTVTVNQNDGVVVKYQWLATAGQIFGSGSTVQFDTSGLSAGTYRVRVEVQREGATPAVCTVDLDIEQPAPPPQATKAGDCGYSKPGAARFDNACKRVGDDVALRLKSEPDAKLVIVGYADPKEPNAKKLAQSRASLAKKYLVEKGIDTSRIITRTGEASTEKGSEEANRRVDFVFVPEGSIY